VNQFKDEIIAELWAAKDEIARANGYDIDRICDAVEKGQRNPGRRIPVRKGSRLVGRKEKIEPQKN